MENGYDLDSWEDMADSGELDKRIESLNVGKNDDDKDEDEDSNITRSASISTEPIVLLEEGSRTQYQPQIKLLRRENAENGYATSSSGASSKPQKTLAERQEEYARARERIFGADEQPKNSETTRPVKSVTVSVKATKKATVSASTGKVKIHSQPNT